MYNLHLETSHFPAQTDTEIRDISVGGLLREIASSHPDSIAMVDVAEDGDCGQSWTYSDLANQAKSSWLDLQGLNKSMTDHSHHLLPHRP